VLCDRAAHNGAHGASFGLRSLLENGAEIVGNDRGIFVMVPLIGCPYGSRFARLVVSSAKCRSLGEPSARYRSSQRIAAFSYFGDPRSA
jgi:hypothetical protein